MKRVKNLVFIGLIALAAAITFAGCENPAGDDPATGGGETYTVTFDADGGSPATQTVTVAKNALVGDGMPGDPSKVGAFFNGWHTEADGGVLFTAATPVTGNITVYARWFTTIAVPPANSGTLAEALAWISSNAVEGGAYTITVKKNETIRGQSLSYNGKRVNITVKGDSAGLKVMLSNETNDNNERDSLFTVRRGVALDVENLTLEGLGNSEAYDPPLVQVNSGGVLKLKAGAVITGNHADDNGGGVLVNGNAEFIMEGGEIRGNTAREGGGVEARGAFTMKGGTISNNTAENGGGVRVGDNAIFVMESGTIKDNTVSNDNGGGVDVRGTFTMKDGEISGNRAKGGGGVRIGDNAIFTLAGGTISGNTATEWGGGGVRADRDTIFTMEGGTISGNTSPGDNGGGVRIGDNAIFTMKNGTISGNTARWSGGGVRIDRNTSFTLEGGTISGNTATEDNGGGVDVDRNAIFILEGGTISGNTAKGGGGVRIGDNASFTIEGGTISGNTATEWQGGGVRIDRDAIVTMQGGRISNNTSTNGGGGLKIEENAIFTMERGTINDNTSNDSGGAVEVWRGTFTMKDGTISDNTAKGGGGVQLHEGATFIMDGGTINGNAATEWGGGGVLVNENASFIKKGGTIYGDTDTTHTSGSAENTATNGGGHVVLLRGGKRRNDTAGPEIKLYAKFENDTWTYNDSSSGGVGDTTANWDNFVAVEDIWGGPNEAEQGVSLALNERYSVYPNNATNKTIIWSVTNAGGTGATISGNILTATAPGDVTITGIVANGTEVGMPFTQERIISVKGRPVTHGDFVVRDILGGVELALYIGNALNVVTPDDLEITVIGSHAFQFKSIISVVVSEGVVKIEENAFLENGDLTSITLPQSLELIIRDAFDNSLASLTVLAEEPPDMPVEDWYTGDRLPASLEHIYVPAGSVNAYKNADGWKDYESIITAITP